MAETKLHYDEELLTKSEEIAGSTEFGFWQTVRGLLFGGSDFAYEVNQAIDLAYSESL